MVQTRDLDFGAILAVTERAKPSVERLPAGRVTPQAAAAIVIAAPHVRSIALKLGALPTVDAGRARVRLPPSGGT